jgi:hypothetical protein
MRWKVKIFREVTASLVFNVLQILILIIGLYLTITQISDLRKVNAGQISLDITRDIYSDERYKTNPKIIRLIEQNKPILKQNNGLFQDQDLDNVLGIWDTIARLNQVGVLPDDLVYAQFSFDIVKAYKNSEIKNYITLTRDQAGDKLIFYDFEWLAKWMEETAYNK